MPPQEPNTTPQPGPGMPPSAPPAGVTPPMPMPDQPAAPGMPPAPSGPAPMQGAMPGSSPDKKKKMMLWIIVAVVVIVLAVGGWFGYKQFFGGITLESYKDDTFSLMVPKGYEKKDGESGVTSFVQKGGNEKDDSSVLVFYQAYPSTLTADELTQVKKELRSQFESSLGSVLSSDSNEKLENLKITDTTFNGKDALRITATAKQDGKEVGNFTLIAVTTNDELYMVGVAARTKDADLQKKADKIIDSFKLEQ